VDPGVAPAPDETSVLRFRHLLKQHDLGVAMLDAVNLHLAATSAANVSDVHMLPDRLPGEGRKVWDDGSYQGQTKAIREAAPKAQDMSCKRTRFKNYVDEAAKKKNTTKIKVRAKVEHVFRILRRVFGFDKVRYRGIAKNHHRLCTNFALINLYLSRKHLAGLAA